MTAREFIIGEEGFISKAQWDVNAYRVGYGSDTLTDINGKVTRVTSTSTTTRAGAERDFARRIKIYENTIIKNLGNVKYWNALNNETKIALLSFAYNYGSIPKLDLRKAIKTADKNIIADTLVKSTLGDNKSKSLKIQKVLLARRKREADLIRNSKGTGSSTAANIILPVSIILITFAFILLR
jgi:GH24 family phage-related lysozyme (muramidase)